MKRRYEPSLLYAAWPSLGRVSGCWRGDGHVLRSETLFHLHTWQEHFECLWWLIVSVIFCHGFCLHRCFSTRLGTRVEMWHWTLRTQQTTCGWPRMSYPTSALGCISIVSRIFLWTCDLKMCPPREFWMCANVWTWLTRKSKCKQMFTCMIFWCLTCCLFELLCDRLKSQASICRNTNTSSAFVQNMYFIHSRAYIWPSLQHSYISPILYLFLVIGNTETLASSQCTFG